MFALIHYSKLTLFAGFTSLNISAKIKTKINEVKVLWGNSVRVNEDKRNAIMCKLFINKLKEICRLYRVGLIIKFPATVSQKRILIPEVTFSFWNTNVRDKLSSKTVLYYQG